ncbi:hypothetical protein D9613_002690 [Agrocybe pediades]|uniref:Uncharacterized protein n=1 Tax=Agrocybe pediades TaxID=84607 RepID=A0A8H4QQX7_9AGAR|nr:hypothetical protein D9613_002690 [Agrocybe pediades]
MDMMVNYDPGQEPLPQNIAAMDTTPISQVDIMAPYLSPSHPDLAPQSPLLSQESELAYLPEQPPVEISAPYSAAMHLPMSDISMPAFMNVQMDTMEPSLIHSDYLSDMRVVPGPGTYSMVPTPEKVDLSPDARNLSISPPQSQIPSPSAHGTSSSYGAGVVSSLESALDSGSTPSVRSRANTSLSPPAFPARSPSNLHSAEYPLGNTSNTGSSLEESVSQQQPQTLIGKMLKDIAITAIDAGDAFEKNSHHTTEQTTKVSELRDRIIQVLDMLGGMSVQELPSNVMPEIMPLPPPPPPPQSHSLTSASLPGETPLIDSTTHLAPSDLSRKRCASDLEEHRTVKAMKREPQEDAPLTMTIQEVTPIPSSGMSYTLPPLAPVSYPAPISRPESPSFVIPTPFGAIKPQTPLTAAFPSFLPSASGPSQAHTSSSVPLVNPIAPPPPLPSFHSAWSDPVVPTRHHHSLSAGAIPGPHAGSSVPPTAGIHPNVAFPSTSQSPLSHPPIVPSNTLPSSMNNPVTRLSRSGSISGLNFRNIYAHPYGDSTSSSRQMPKASTSSGKNSQSNWYMGSELMNSSRKGHSNVASLSDDDDDDESSDSDEETAGKTSANRVGGERHATNNASDLPADYCADVDRIFFQFLNKLCSNLEATDSKGEQIHQTLMPKKMQRLDESPDFRPFKFRIQAFTNSFMDELAKQGYPEEKIPMKKARNYLWRQHYIQRFNEDGKKAKSKGNHIWIVEARKAGEGQWEFRPFQKKLAGNPPNVAYCGLLWSWKPHIWHPQFSFKKTPVTFSSPNLPSWLSWKNGELSGIPPPDAQDCTITVVAKFPFDNQDDHVSHTFTICIAPASALDSNATFSRSRRPSLVGEPPKRSTSDSALFSMPNRVNPRLTRKDDTRVIQVLQKVAQRVTDEAASQIVSDSPGEGELEDLVKQKHVLDSTVSAYGEAIAGQSHGVSRRLAVAAQHVVLQAAKTVIADRTVASGGVPVPQKETVAMQSVSVSELTDKTQDAIAMAVKMNGTASNEVDIIVTATSILKSQTPVIDTPAGPLLPATRASPSAPTVPSRLASTFPISNLTPLPEYS